MLKLADSLNKLLEAHDISASELSRATKIVQPVIYRLMTGETDNPRIATLIPIANYFSVSVDQLLGKEPIHITEKHKQSQNHINQVPILTWEQATIWPKVKMNAKTQYLQVLDNNAHDLFVLIMSGTTMCPRFPDGTVLIINTKQLPQNEDFVVAHIKGQQKAIFRQLLLDNDEIALKPLNPDFKIFYSHKDDCSFVGVLTEARLSFKKV